jgi:hypothetical protein
VLRTQPKSTYDQAPSAILELVDGRRDMRFAMTAAAVARDRANNTESTDLTLRNMAKVTRFRTDGEAKFDAMVEQIRQNFGSLEVSAERESVEESDATAPAARAKRPFRKDKYVH